MRVIRFVGDDGRVLLGEDRLDGTATVLLDVEGVLGRNQAEQAHREVLRGKRALVADDDEGIRREITGALEKYDCRCTVCKDGAEAIRAIGERDLDVVVSDIVMPESNGYEVFAAARRRTPSPAVVLVTGFGYDPDHSLVRASREGCEAVLYKPFTPPQLVAKVAEAVRASANGECRALLRTSERVTVGSLLAPLTPRDILCVGRNYAADAAAAAAGGDDDLELFMKPRSSVQDPERAIVLPAAAEDPQVDAEGEFAVVIGTRARHVPEAEALRHVLGYTAANDVTARRWLQSAPAAWMRGKGFDTFCPVGPAIVTADDLPDPGGLEVTTSVNGRVTRRGNTGRLIRPVARLVSELSARITLHPGTLLLTGAPPRVDPSPAPGLLPGDEVCVEIDRIGRLINPVAGA